MDAPAGDNHEPGAMPSPSRQQQPLPVGSGPFALRALLEDVPLVTDETGDDVKITCVDYLGAYARSLASWWPGLPMRAPPPQANT